MSDIDVLANEFIEATAACHGELARPNGTHFAYALVTLPLVFIRQRLSKGEILLADGERFLASAAAYLAQIACGSFVRRGFDVSSRVHFEAGGGENCLRVQVRRHRDGQDEFYVHDFLHDMFKVVLPAPQPFPFMGKGGYFILSSWTLPSVEYLYMTGVHFMVSPCATGNWPVETAGGLDEDFDRSCASLVDDLLVDIHLPTEDADFRRLSASAVWPPYAWHGDSWQEGAMSAFVKQIGRDGAVDTEKGIRYLRCLLRSQAFHLRNLAARSLMVLGESPESLEEADSYLQAFGAADSAVASQSMIALCWQLNGNDAQSRPSDEFADEMNSNWDDLIKRAPCPAWCDAPILSDPLYLRLDALEPGTPERLEVTRQVLDRYPGDWFAQTAHAHTLAVGGDADAARQLEELLDECPGDPNAHFWFGRYLHKEGYDYQVLKAHCHDMVERWPWNPKTVGNAIWLLTLTMSGRS